MRVAMEFTRDDRLFLHTIGVDPEPGIVDTMEDILAAPGNSPPPTNILISATLAKAIAGEYGELNWDTYVAYRLGHSRERDKEK